MRNALSLTLLILLFAVSGCRVNPNAEREIALLRSEILDLEDQYYSLKSQRDTAVSQLRDCQGSSFDESFFHDPNLDGECLDCGAGEVVYGSSPIVYEDQSYVEPIGGMVQPYGGTTELNTMDQIQSIESGSPVIGTDPALEEIPRSDDVEPLEGENTSLRNRMDPNLRGVPKMSAIRVHPQLTIAEDLDGNPGHEGITLFVQPINRNGHFVATAGQLTVQLLERDRLASSRQIGFWSFTAEEIRNFQVRDDLRDQGILLHLPWGPILPTRNNVSVVINFVSADNVRFTNRAKISIEPPAKRYSLDDELIANWIENDQRWREAGTDLLFDPTKSDLELDFKRPMFKNASDTIEIQNPSFESDSERRTSVPRWRPVR